MVKSYDRYLIPKLLLQFLHFGSNSSVSSNSGIRVCTLSWEFVSRSLPHCFQWMLQAALKLCCMDCSLRLTASSDKAVSFTRLAIWVLTTA